MFSGKYDKECLEMLKALGEWVEAIAGAALLFASIIGIWFIGCAVI